MASTWLLAHAALVLATSSGPASALGPALHRMQPASGRVIHMAGQSAAEFGNYSSFLPSATRPAVFTT